MRALSIIVSISYSNHTLNFHDENSTFTNARLNFDRRTHNEYYNPNPHEYNIHTSQTWHVCTFHLNIITRFPHYKAKTRSKSRKFSFFLFFWKSFFQDFFFSFTDYCVLLRTLRLYGGYVRWLLYNISPYRRQQYSTMGGVGGAVLPISNSYRNSQSNLYTFI